MLYWIALAHAIPLFVCRMVTRSKLVLLFVAMLMVCLGVLTGNPAYAVIDVAAVAIGLAITWPRPPSAPPSLAAPAALTARGPSVPVGPARWVEISPQPLKRRPTVFGVVLTLVIFAAGTVLADAIWGLPFISATTTGAPTEPKSALTAVK